MADKLWLMTCIREEELEIQTILCLGFLWAGDLELTFLRKLLVSLYLTDFCITTLARLVVGLPSTPSTRLTTPVTVPLKNALNFEELFHS